MSEFSENKGRETTGIILDRLTGLLTRDAFLVKLQEVIDAGELQGGVIFIDIRRFKALNDMFGIEEGDKLLVYIANFLKGSVPPAGFSSRLNADRFVCYLPGDQTSLKHFAGNLIDAVASYNLHFQFLCNAGICMLKEGVSATATVDHAIIAQKDIKGRFDIRIRFYDEDLRENMIVEQEIAGMMRGALDEGQFTVYFQPQFNHSNGKMIGAEALARWKHPQKGIIPPPEFMPVFERNGFITTLDSYVFEQVCIFIKEQMDRMANIVPISVNLTRYDIYSPGFIEKLEAIRERYDVPARYIRIELTENTMLGGLGFVNDVLAKFHDYGYIIEMDDFGSGYSSLNVLKELDFDVIKIDMNFFRNVSSRHGKRGGIILSSIVRMLNWLQLPIIAEGVETVEQANFLRSVGCYCIQGYLYSRAIPTDEFRKLLDSAEPSVEIPQMRIMNTMDADNFWSSESLETLIFSNFVGGAAVFEYGNGRAEALRVNQKYLDELNVDLIESDILYKNLFDYLDEENREKYVAMLERALETDEEQECETWRLIESDLCGEDHICIRANVRVIAQTDDSAIFYAMIRNVTSEIEHLSEIEESAKLFEVASEHEKIYSWEYDIATHDMHPCTRCMRDLGLPKVLHNYPNSAIERGVFPPEVADMYRDMMRQIDEGAPALEAVIPLTMDRVMARVRYTTIFDGEGNAIKAFGSAKILDGEGEDK